MAINFKKLSTGRSRMTSGGIDFGKLAGTRKRPKKDPVPEPVSDPRVRTVSLPAHLGGGQYKTSGPGSLIKTERDQSALGPALKGKERDHKISVALGGTSDKTNLQYLHSRFGTKYGDPERQEGKLSVEQKSIDDYLDGKISLPQARAQVAAKQQEIKGLIPVQGTVNYLWDGFKDIFSPFTKARDTIKKKLTQKTTSDDVFRAEVGEGLDTDIQVQTGPRVATQEALKRGENIRFARLADGRTFDNKQKKVVDEVSDLPFYASEKTQAQNVVDARIDKAQRDIERGLGQSAGEEFAKGIIRGVKYRLPESINSVFGWWSDNLINTPNTTRGKIQKKFGVDKVEPFLGRVMSKTLNRIQDYIDDAEKANTAVKIHPSVMSDNTIVDQTGTRLSVMIGENVPTLALAAGISSVASPMVGASALGLIEGTGQYQEARSAGLSQKEANVVGILSVIGTTILEKYPLDFIVSGKAGSILPKMIISGTAEGSEESLQTYWNNILAKMSYDKSRRWYEGIVDSFIVGAATGGIVGGMAGNGTNYRTIHKLEEDAIAAGVPKEDFDKVKEQIASLLIKESNEIEASLQKAIDTNEPYQLINKPIDFKKLGKPIIETKLETDEQVQSVQDIVVNQEENLESIDGFETFSKLADRWIREVDPEGRQDAFDYVTRDFPELGEALREEYFAGDIPQLVNAYRVGGVNEGIVSLFPTEAQANSYAERFDVDEVEKLIVRTENLVPSGSGSGEVWVATTDIVDDSVAEQQDKKNDAETKLETEQTTEQPLIEEAKKYKTADEFIENSEYKYTYYHATPKSNIEKINKKGFSDDVFVWPDENIAKEYAKGSGKNWGIVEVKSKEKLIADNPKLTDEMRMDNPDWWSLKGDSVKTKQQLTDIFNKAKKDGADVREFEREEKKAEQPLVPKKKPIKIEYESETSFDKFDEPRIKTVTVPKYLYHTTSPDNVDSIAKKGLIKKHDSNFEGTANATFAWTSPSEVGPGEVITGKVAKIRINTDALKSSKDIGIDTDFGGDIDDIAGDIWQIYKDIKPEFLEKKVGNKWVPLKDVTPLKPKSKPLVPKSKADNLTEEVKKYKTVDEFIESQGRRYFHGTTKRASGIINKEGFKVGGRQRTGNQLGKGTYLTSQKDEAAFFAEGFRPTKTPKDTVSVRVNGKLKRIPSIRGDNGLNDLIEDALYTKGRFTDEEITALSKSQDKMIQQYQDYLTQKGYVGMQMNSQVVIFDPKNIKTEAQLRKSFKKETKKPVKKATKKKPAKEEVKEKKGPKKVYRTSDTPFDPNKITESGISLTTDKNFDISGKGRIKEQLSIDPRAKILKFEDIPDRFIDRSRPERLRPAFDNTYVSDAGNKKIVDYAKSKGFDGVDLSGFGEGEIRMFTGDFIKAKGVDLATEAKKFKKEEPDKKSFSKHYERIKDEKGFDDLGAEFERVTNKEQIRKAYNYIQRNPQKAMQIAYGLKSAPIGINVQAIRQSLIASLLESGKKAQAQEIAKMASKEFTLAAQTLNLAKADFGTEPTITKDITQARLQKIGEKAGKVKPEEAREEGAKIVKTRTKEAAKTIKKNQAKVSKEVLQDMENIINNLIC